MITPFSTGIQREFANYLNKLFTFNDYFQLFFAHSNCYIVLNKCSEMSARILGKKLWVNVRRSEYFFKCTEVLDFVCDRYIEILHILKLRQFIVSINWYWMCR